MEKESFGLRARTFIFQLVVVICVFIVAGLLPSPANILFIGIVIAVMLNRKKLFNKKEKEKDI